MTAIGLEHGTPVLTPRRILLVLAAVAVVHGATCTEGTTGNKCRATSGAVQHRAGKPSVFSDYDTLKYVVIGRADHYSLPTDEEEPLFDEAEAANEAEVPEKFMDRYYQDEGGRDESDDPDEEVAAGRYPNAGQQGVVYPQKMIDESNRALDGLCQVLEGRGVKVWRTDMQGKPKNSKAGDWGYSTRDLMIMIGDTLFLTPTPYVSRSHEVDAVYGHIINQSQAGDDSTLHQWQADTKVVDLRTAAYWERRKQGSRAFMRSEWEPKTDIPLTEEVPLFDAANCFVLNEKAVVYLVSVGGNRAGAKLLQQHVAPMGMEVVLVEGVYYGSHIDTTILPLSRKKIIFAEGRLTKQKMEQLFGKFGYDRDSFIGISATDIVKVEAPFMSDTSNWIALNVLQLSSKAVIVEAKQIGVARKLEAHGFEVLRVPLPYTRDLGGSFHCISCPLYRELS